MFDLQKCSFIWLGLMVCPSSRGYMAGLGRELRLDSKLPCRGFQEARGRQEGPLYGHAPRGSLTLRPAQLLPLSGLSPSTQVQTRHTMGLGEDWVA